MGDRLGIRGAVDILLLDFKFSKFINSEKTFAPGEARTHGLQIMRLTRCLLRYRGYVDNVNHNKGNHKGEIHVDMQKN